MNRKELITALVEKYAKLKELPAWTYCDKTTIAEEFREKMFAFAGKEAGLYRFSFGGLVPKENLSPNPEVKTIAELATYLIRLRASLEDLAAFLNTNFNRIAPAADEAIMKVNGGKRWENHLVPMLRKRHRLPKDFYFRTLLELAEYLAVR